MSQPPHGPGSPPFQAPQAPPYGAPPPYPPPAAPGAGVLDALVPTNPLAAVSCWTGIFSVLLCGFGVVLGLIALVTGILSLKTGALIQQSAYGKATSTARSWIGIVSGVVGTVASLIVLVVALLGKR